MNNIRVELLLEIDEHEVRQIDGIRSCKQLVKGEVGVCKRQYEI